MLRVVKVYVDELEAWGEIVGYRGKDAEQARRVGTRHAHRWCHLFADEADCPELHAFARRIGIKREWFQGDHYDIVPTKRAQAVRRGAIVVSREEMVRIFDGHKRKRTLFG